MRDIVERLRDSNTTRRIGESYADVHDRRQADRNESADTITRLTARVAELEAALRPLACTCEAESQDECSRSEKHCPFWNARAALTNGESNDH